MIESQYLAYISPLLPMLISRMPINHNYSSKLRQTVPISLKTSISLPKDQWDGASLLIAAVSRPACMNTFRFTSRAKFFRILVKN